MIKTNKMFLTASAMILSVSAQAFTLKGVVVDNSTKEPLIGATVQVGGTTTGVITDIDGRFEIKVTILFSALTRMFPKPTFAP